MKLSGTIYRGGIRGYTLLEMMVVVFVMAIIMGLSVPNLMAKARRDALSQGVHDFVEACQNAREIAILTGQSMQVVLMPESIHVEVAPKRDAGRWVGGERMATEVPALADGAPKAKRPTPYHATLGEHVVFDFEGARVNLRKVDMVNDDRLILKFHPNGTCDQFEGILKRPGVGEYQLTTEVTTGWVETTRLR